jgi:uncharacterized protein (TIGR02598 family)
MNNRTHSTAAFSLVEVALALGVAGFCLITILGLMPASLKTNQTSTRQTTANGILSAIVADLRATPATSTTSNLFGIQFQRNTTTTLYFDGDGRKVGQTTGNPIFFATVKFSSSGGGGGGGDTDEGDGRSGSQRTNTVAVSDSGGGDSDEGGPGRTASFAHVIVGWPASAGSAGGGGDNDDNDDHGGGSSPAAAGIVETFVGLDRN